MALWQLARFCCGSWRVFAVAVGAFLLWQLARFCCGSWRRLRRISRPRAPVPSVSPPAHFTAEFAETRLRAARKAVAKGSPRHRPRIMQPQGMGALSVRVALLRDRAITYQRSFVVKRLRSSGDARPYRIGITLFWFAIAVERGRSTLPFCVYFGR